jgi:hypothetical protein
MKQITLEEHFSVPEMSYRLKRRFASAYAQELDARLLDVEQWRLPEMDQLRLSRCSWSPHPALKTSACIPGNC